MKEHGPHERSREGNEQQDSGNYEHTPPAPSETIWSNDTKKRQNEPANRRSHVDGARSFVGFCTHCVHCSGLPVLRQCLGPSHVRNSCGSTHGKPAMRSASNRGIAPVRSSVAPAFPPPPSGLRRTGRPGMTRPPRNSQALQGLPTPAPRGEGRERPATPRGPENPGLKPGATDDGRSLQPIGGHPPPADGAILCLPPPPVKGKQHVAPRRSAPAARRNRLTPGGCSGRRRD